MLETCALLVPHAPPNCDFRVHSHPRNTFKSTRSAHTIFLPLIFSSSAPHTLRADSPHGRVSPPPGFPGWPSETHRMLHAHLPIGAALATISTWPLIHTYLQSPYHTLRVIPSLSASFSPRLRPRPYHARANLPRHLCSYIHSPASELPVPLTLTECHHLPCASHTPLSSSVLPLGSASRSPHLQAPS